MRKLVICSVVLALGSADVALAGGPFFGRFIRVSNDNGPRLAQVVPLGVPPRIEPVPAQGYQVMSGPVVGGPVISGPGLELFQCVKYKSTRNIAPCAVPMIVSVPAPCECQDPCNACAPPRCVNVQICVPQCPCPPKVTTSCNGRKTRYDFGEYAVNITSKSDRVVVDYDD